MSSKLSAVLSNINHQDYATTAGRDMHKKMQQIIITATETIGDTEICDKIIHTPNLSRFFTPVSKTEVPIAGHINNHFISRRIDRLVINDTEKTVYILDYKTDADKLTFRDKYFNQLTEYTLLLSEIYPSYKISAYILWLHDFELEQVI